MQPANRLPDVRSRRHSTHCPMPLLNQGGKFPSGREGRIRGKSVSKVSSVSIRAFPSVMLKPLWTLPRVIDPLNPVYAALPSSLRRGWPPAEPTPANPPAPAPPRQSPFLPERPQARALCPPPDSHPGAGRRAPATTSLLGDSQPHQPPLPGGLAARATDGGAAGTPGVVLRLEGPGASEANRGSY